METDELLWDVSAEQSVVGSILLSPNCLPDVERELNPNDFRLDADRAIYEAALALERVGKKVDVVTILDRAAKMGRPVSREYALELLEVTPTAANVAEYIQIVRENALRSRLLGVSDTIRDGVLGREVPQTVLTQGAQMLTDLMRQGTAGRLSSPTDQLAAFYRQRDAIDNGDAKGYVCTGYMALDKLLGGGMINSGLYLLAARPGMGKTTLALNIADRVAQADPVLFVSLEMDDEQLTAKRIARETGISSEKLLMQPLSDREYAQVAEAIVRECHIMESDVCVLQRNIFPVFVYHLGVFNAVQFIQRSINDLQYMGGVVHGFHTSKDHKGEHIQHEHGRKFHTAVIGQHSSHSYNGNGGGFQRKQVQAVEGHIFHFNFDVDFLAVVVCFADTGNRHAFLLKGFHHLHPSQILDGTFHHIVLCLLMDRRVLVAARLQQMKKQGRQKDTSQSNSSRQRTIKCKEQYQDDNGDIAINNGVDHIHGEHFHKREVGCGRCGQFAHIVLTEKAQRHPLQNISQPYSLVSGCFITDTFLRDGSEV